MDSLIRCGALDGMGLNRRQMLQMAPLVFDQLEGQGRTLLEGQVGFFDAAEAAGETPVAAPELPELPFMELLRMEKDATGLYLSGHPLTPYKEYYKALKLDRLSRVLTALEEEDTSTYRDGTTVQLLCLVGAVRTQMTKAGARMATVQLEDLYGSIEATVFPKQLAQYEGLLQTGQAVLVRGRLDVQEEREPKLLCERVEPIPAELPKPAQPSGRDTSAPPQAAKPAAHPGLYLRLPASSGEVYRHTQRLLRVFEGPLPVYLRFADTGKLVRTPSDWWVDPPPVLIQELKRLLGEENVVLLK